MHFSHWIASNNLNLFVVTIMISTPRLASALIQREHVLILEVKIHLVGQHNRLLHVLYCKKLLIVNIFLLESQIHRTVSSGLECCVKKETEGWWEGIDNAYMKVLN